MIKTTQHNVFSWNMRLPNTFRVTSPFKIIFLDFRTYGANLLTWFMISCLMHLSQLFRKFMNRVREKSKRDQFLMKLQLEFEATRSNLMNRDPSPSLDVFWRINPGEAASWNISQISAR